MTDTDVLSLSNVTKTFGPVRALDHLSLTLAPGGARVPGPQWGREVHNDAHPVGDTSP